jgi:small subunit ribosomal protein S2
VAKELARELINAGVHFGHGISRWNPKMKPYIFTKRGNIHIVDVRKTLEGILIAKKLLVDIVSSGKDVIFVGTKRQAQKAVENAATKCGMHFVSGRWLGGTLTNFRTIRSRLQRLTELESLEQSGSMEKESKKHASRLKRELKKIKANLDSIRNMTRLPGTVIVVDSKKEYLALREARKLGIPTIGVIDTDADPDTVDVVIPANDDSIRAIDLIMNELADAVSVGKTLVGTRLQETKPRPKRIRSRRPTLARAGTEQAETAVVVESEDEPAAQGGEPPSEEPTPPEQPEEKPNQ